MKENEFSRDSLQLEIIDLSYNNFTKIPKNFIDNFYLNSFALNLSNNLFSNSIHYTNLNKLSYLNLSNNNIENIILENCNNLRVLKLTNNKNLNKILIINCPLLIKVVLGNTSPSYREYKYCNKNLKEYICETFEILY